MILILMLSVALAMDAFAVSISLGMAGLARSMVNRLKIAFTFGLFQAGLFTLGYLSISMFGDQFNSFYSYVSAVLLALLGIKMIKEVYSEEINSCPHQVCLGLECGREKCDRTGQYRILTMKLLLIFGFATSIDSFVAGVANPKIQIWFASISIGIITAMLSFIGGSIGFKIKNKIGKYANLLGGLILLFLAIKSLF